MSTTTAWICIILGMWSHNMVLTYHLPYRACCRAYCPVMQSVCTPILNIHFHSTPSGTLYLWSGWTRRLKPLSDELHGGFCYLYHDFILETLIKDLHTNTWLFFIWPSEQKFLTIILWMSWCTSANSPSARIGSPVLLGQNFWLGLLALVLIGMMSNSKFMKTINGMQQTTKWPTAAEWNIIYCLVSGFPAGFYALWWSGWHLGWGAMIWI